MQKKDSILEKRSLHSDDLLFFENDVTTKMALIPEVRKQIWYGFYGLCWHHKLIPLNIALDKTKYSCEWEAAMLFPKDTIARVEKKFEQMSIYHGIYGRVQIFHLIKGLGSSSTDALLNCISRYGLANSRIRKRSYYKFVHHDAGQVQEILEEPYVLSMLNFQTLDELELLLSTEGFSEDKVPTFKIRNPNTQKTKLLFQYL